MKSWKICCLKYPAQEVIFCAQVLLIYIVVLTCVLNLSFSSEKDCLWLSLLSGSLGYLLPSPKPKKKNEPLLSNSTEQQL